MLALEAKEWKRVIYFCVLCTHAYIFYTYRYDKSLKYSGIDLMSGISIFDIYIYEKAYICLIYAKNYAKLC